MQQAQAPPQQPEVQHAQQPHAPQQSAEGAEPDMRANPTTLAIMSIMDLTPSIGEVSSIRLGSGADARPPAEHAPGRQCE